MKLNQSKDGAFNFGIVESGHYEGELGIAHELDKGDNPDWKIWMIVVWTGANWEHFNCYVNMNFNSALKIACELKHVQMNFIDDMLYA